MDYSGRRVFIFLLLLVGFSATAQQKEQKKSAATSDKIRQVSKLIDQSYEDLVKLYQHLHQHPELFFQEKETSKVMAAQLRDLGFAVTENVGGFGVVGVLKNGTGPTVMVRTDMDALPIKEETGLPFASKVTTDDGNGKTVPVMHACGHDFHMVSWIGTARILTQLKNQWSGTLVFIAQPAEEQAAGAKAMIDDGLFTRFPRPDFGLGLHVNASLEAGKLGYTLGHALANVDQVSIKVIGRGGHGASPHNTVDPIVLASRIVLSLQTMVAREIDAIEDPTVISVGSIHGGNKANIIPNEVNLELTVRSFVDQTRKTIIEKIRRTCNGLAMSAGLSEKDYPVVTVREDYTPSVYNDPELTRKMSEVFRDVVGAENVVVLNRLMVGEDFSHYTRVDPAIPTLLYSVGTVSPDAMQDRNRPLNYTHSSKYQPEIEPSLRMGITSMSMGVLQLLKK
jgi:hippurate hydrolase